jgi:hypothetical protein
MGGSRSYHSLARRPNSSAPKEKRFPQFADAEYSTDQQWTPVLSREPLRVDAVEKGGSRLSGRLVTSLVARAPSTPTRALSKSYPFADRSPSRLGGRMPNSASGNSDVSLLRWRAGSRTKHRDNPFGRWLRRPAAGQRAVCGYHRSYDRGLRGVKCLYSVILRFLTADAWCGRAPRRSPTVLSTDPRRKPMPNSTVPRPRD